MNNERDLHNNIKKKCHRITSTVATRYFDTRDPFVQRTTLIAICAKPVSKSFFQISPFLMIFRDTKGKCKICQKTPTVIECNIKLYFFRKIKLFYQIPHQLIVYYRVITFNVTKF